MNDNVDLKFPTWGLLPKRETEVSKFLTKYPNYDGRDTVIAVFDSGVDPGAPGLQKTSDGKCKIIARFDCSGAGDVDTSTTVHCDEHNVIHGLSGRSLQIPSGWNNPSGIFHIGLKSMYELYSRKLRDRVVKHRKETYWDPQFKAAQADIIRRLEAYDQEVNNPSTTYEKLNKEDLEARVEIIGSLEKKYNDVGPALDCVVFFDGTCWKACIDTSECGELDKCVLLNEYSFGQEFATLHDFDNLNYSINVHNDGNTLEIVSMCSSHGTHVASIAAAYFPDDPDKNGVAPGAQIASFSIGDNRLSAMETGTAIVRAMIHVINMKIPIINMSYGEHAHFPTGRIGELMNEVIDSHNVVWVCSAGNHGPGLSTVGSPPDICANTVIGVGAYVSPEMMAAEYSLREKLPGMAYTWSSCGPTIDGDCGVSVCAPGAAITSVPNFTLRNSQLMNGTSMAAPHVSGAIALLLSAMKASSMNVSPYCVKRTLENTAMYLSSVDPFVQGCGLLQVEKAYEHMCSYNKEVERDVRFQILCGNNNNKGIYLRGGLQNKPYECSVSVKPVFLDTKQVGSEQKINFNLNVVLCCSETWIHFPVHLNITNVQRSFILKVDPTSLASGSHFTCILAYDVACLEKGPVFRIPITVVKPNTVPSNGLRPVLSFKDVVFRPGTMKRHFIVAPQGATWAVLTLVSKQEMNSGKFIIHCTQLKPKKMCKAYEHIQLANVSSVEAVQGFSVTENLVLEMVVAKYWANIGEMIIDYNIEFRGIKPDVPIITMQASDGILSTHVTSYLRNEEVSPVVTLKDMVQVLRPAESKLVVLLKRDVIPPERQIYELQLTYNFSIPKSTEITPSSPFFSNFLYESEFESQLWMLFDSNKQLLASGDAYPKKYQTKVEKGDYTIRMHVRHEKKELLDRLLEKPLILSYKLSSTVNLDIYADYSQAVIGGKKANSFSITTGESAAMYIAPLNNDKFSKGATLGQFLSGTITYAKDELGKKVDVYPFHYVLYEPPKKNSSSSKGADNKEKDKTKLEQYNEALRDMKISWLSKLDPDSNAAALYEELKSQYPDYLPVYVSMLQCLNPLENKHQIPLLLKYSLDECDSDKICSVADSILSSVDKVELLAEIGAKGGIMPDNVKKKRFQLISTETITSTSCMVEKKKSAVIEAMVHKGIILARQYMCKKQASSPVPEEEKETINSLWLEMLQFSDAGDPKAIYFSMWHALVYEHYGRLLKMLLKLHDEKSSLETEEMIISVMNLLGWTFSAKMNKDSIPVRYPQTYHHF